MNTAGTQQDCDQSPPVWFRPRHDDSRNVDVFSTGPGLAKPLRETELGGRLLQSHLFFRRMGRVFRNSPDRSPPVLREVLLELGEDLADDGRLRLAKLGGRGPIADEAVFHV